LLASVDITDLDNRSISNLGSAYTTLVRPVDPPLSASLPSEIDDFYVYENRIEPQPVSDMPPLVAAPNLMTSFHIAICTPTIMAAGTETSSETSFGPNLSACTSAARNALDSLQGIISSAPPTLTSPLGPLDLSDDIFVAADKRRAVQLELQKAAISISAFSCRNYLLSWLDTQIQRNNAQSIDQDARDNALLMSLITDSSSTDKEEATRAANLLLQEDSTSLVADLAAFLKTLDVVHLEPNSMSSVSHHARCSILMKAYMSQLTALHSILPLIHSRLKNDDTERGADGAATELPGEDPTSEDAQFVLLKVDALDKELAAISREDVLNLDETIPMEDSQMISNGEADTVS
jgi:hypothetical protein